MAERRNPQKGKSKRGSGKVGSDPEALREIGGKGDFGVPAGDARTADRDYVSANTKASDPGNAQPDSHENEGVRTHGAGGKATGEGSSSGGDLDTDFIGVGTGGSGLAANPPTGFKPGPDDSDGTSNEMGSGPPAKGEHQEDANAIGGPRPVHRSIAQANADLAEPAGQGADSTGNLQGNDAAAGEVSSDEAAGQDNDH